MDSKDFKQIVERYFVENAIEDCFWVDAKLSGKKIEVFIDKDGGISFDICKQVSRHLEEILDANLAFGEDYTLEVSSPGVGSPLKNVRQYKNNIGRQIEIKTSEEKISGVLSEANEANCIVTVETTEKVEGKKKKIVINHDIKYVDIVEAKIKISF